MSTDSTASHAVGVGLVLAAVSAWSTAGLFVRIVDLDVWSVLFWRGLFAAAALLLLLVLVHGWRALYALRRTGAGGVIVGGCHALASIAYIVALDLTSVADVAVIYATGPMVTAGLAWFCLGERPRTGMIGAAAVSVLGMVLIVSASSGERHLLGNAVAVLMTLAVAAMTLLIRARRDVDMAPAALLSALMTAFVTLPLAGSAMPPADKLAWLALFGAVQMALGLVLFILGSRRLPPGEAALLTLMEAPLATLLVWLALGEAPSTATVIGGALVGTSILIHLAVQYRWRPARSLQASWTTTLP